MTVFRDRKHAGELLAEALAGEAGVDTLVVGLPRGGVPVAREVARALGAPLDVFVVRKLGVPFQPELAMGAIASGGILVRNESVLRVVPDAEANLERIRRREQAALEERERLYRGRTGTLDVAGRKVIVVDDGIATGSTMKAAVQALKSAGAARVVVAIPVGPAESCRELERIADKLVCLQTPAGFAAVGQWYENFDQTSDEEVRRLLADGRA